MKFKELFSKWWFKLLLLGIAARVVLMPITLHPDLLGHSFSAYFFAYKGKLNVYEELLSLPKDHPLVKNVGISDIFIYPPLAYFTLGFFRLMVRPFENPNFIPWAWENISRLSTFKGIYLQLFLYKLPYLFVDLGIAFLLSSLFEDVKKKKQAFALWIFNPISLYATFMIGQLDILPVFFTVLSCFFIHKKKNILALISLGIGASYKMYPLFFVVPAAFILGETFKEKIKYLFWGFLPFVVTIAPFLTSKAFRQMVLFAPKSQKMLFMGFNLSGAEVIYPFIIFLTVFFLISYFAKKKLNLEIYIISILLLIFSITHYHPQWFLWVTPFLIWDLARNNFKNWIITFLLLASWLFITLFFEPSLSFGLFNPIWPGLNNAKGLSEVVGKYTDVYQLKSMARSVFAGASLFYCLHLFKLFRLDNE